MKAKIYTRNEFIDLLEQKPMSYTQKRVWSPNPTCPIETVELYEYYAPLDMRENPDPEVKALMEQNRIGFAIAFNTSFGALAREMYRKDNQIANQKKQIDELTKLPPKSEKEAKWEIDCDGYYPYCTECGTEPSYNIVAAYNFMLPCTCPHCGAKMTNYKEFGEYHKIG